MVRATPYASNSQSSKTAVNEGNAIGKRRMKDDLTEAVNIQNQLEMCCGGWLGRKNARRCGLNLLKYALGESREYSLLLFTSAAALKKNRPAGMHLNRTTMGICEIYYCRNSPFVSKATIIERPRTSIYHCRQYLPIANIIKKSYTIPEIPGHNWLRGMIVA